MKKIFTLEIRRSFFEEGIYHFDLYLLRIKIVSWKFETLNGFIK